MLGGFVGILCYLPVLRPAVIACDKAEPAVGTFLQNPVHQRFGGIGISVRSANMIVLHHRKGDIGGVADVAAHLISVLRPSAVFVDESGHARTVLPAGIRRDTTGAICVADASGLIAVVLARVDKRV